MGANGYDPVPDLAALLHSALWGRRDVITYADRIAKRLGLGEDDSPETAAEVLRKALGLDAAPAPRMRRTNAFAGSDEARQSIGLPGHCGDCAEKGHVAAHPDLGCGDVGCDRDHGDAEPEPAEDRS